MTDRVDWVWDSPEERERTIAAAKKSPPGPRERRLAYIARLAEEAGLLRPEQIRLREPGEEG